MRRIFLDPEAMAKWLEDRGKKSENRSQQDPGYCWYFKRVRLRRMRKPAHETCALPIIGQKADGTVKMKELRKGTLRLP